MDFAPRAGCPMCSIVAKGLHNAPNSASPFSPPLNFSQQQSRTAKEDTSPEILWRDDNFTVYRERAYPVSSKAHLIIVFNLHVPSLYTLSSSDVPLLVSLRNTAHRFLSALTQSPPSPLATPTPMPMTANSTASSTTTLVQSPPLNAATPLDPQQSSNFRVGFISPPFKDSCIPVKDHLHAHAYVAPNDRCGWWRGVAFGPLAWYAVDDLIAEIRESSSNNRVKSGYENRGSAPINRVADAGMRSGTANGLETTDAPLAALDVETGVHGRPQRQSSYDSVPSGSRPGNQATQALLSPPPTLLRGGLERRTSSNSSTPSTPSPRTSVALYD